MFIIKNNYYLYIENTMSINLNHLKNHNTDIFRMYLVTYGTNSLIIKINPIIFSTQLNLGQIQSYSGQIQSYAVVCKI